ncbi:MAG: tetratricopeptide repeat protein [Alphaproteobacteria bacterium]
MSELLTIAVHHHQSGRLHEAGDYYRRVLDGEPDNPNALHLYGLLAHEQGDIATALQRIGRAVALNPQSALFHFNLGLVQGDDGDLKAAAGSYQQAISLKPDFADAHNNLGLVRQKQDRAPDAAACFEAAVTLQPDHVEALVNLGKARRDQGRPGDALRCFEQAAGLRPGLAEAHFEIGKCAEDRSAWDDAAAAFREALQHKPELLEARNNLATSLLALGDYGEAQAVFHQVMEARHGTVRDTADDLAAEAEPKVGGAGRPGPPGDGFIWRDRLADRTEQLEHLLSRGRLDRSYAALTGRCRVLLDAPPDPVAPAGAVTLPNDQSGQINGLCDSICKWSNTPPLPGGAINWGLAFDHIEDSYLSSPTNAVYFDDFLSSEALGALRQFCNESTVFFGRDPAGYVSSYLRDGFNCDLLYQIAGELKQCLPRVIGDQFLSNMWAYRHGAGGHGVVAHTDYGAVTFNFWITPDSANLDPASGGLVVYRKEEPYDWDWMEVNREKNAPRIKEKIERYLESAETLTIPYRDNRAVLFHSNLFHASDVMRFRSGFENRRVNISMLFGKRGAPAP